MKSLWEEPVDATVEEYFDGGETINCKVSVMDPERRSSTEGRRSMIATGKRLSMDTPSMNAGSSGRTDDERVKGNGNVHRCLKIFNRGARKAVNGARKQSEAEEASLEKSGIMFANRSGNKLRKGHKK